jgi:hypothetical protein
MPTTHPRETATTNPQARPGREPPMKKPSTIRPKFAAALLSLASACALATEGGGLSVYPDGLENFMSGALPPAGVHFLVYGGMARYDKVRDDRGNEVPIPGFKVNVGVVAPRLVWVTGQSLLGGQLAFSAIAPILDVKFQAAGATFKSSGLGDVAFGPALGYHASPNLHYVVAADFFAPTGRYDKTDPSSLGKNHWTVQPIVAVSYIDPAGLNADIKLMVDINRKNDDTQTKSGQALHADFALGWGLGNGLALGAGGHFFSQVTDDSGPASAVGKARALGLGPSLRYFDGKGLLITAKFQKEFSVRNRPEGSQFYVKATLPF